MRTLAVVYPLQSRLQKTLLIFGKCFSDHVLSPCPK